MSKTQARLNITVHGQNADLPQAVPFSATDDQIKQWAAEAIASGSVPGLSGKPALWDHVVDRFPASLAVPYPRIFLRPPTPFG